MLESPHTHIICLETDEGKHKNNQYPCEVKRMLDMPGNVSGASVIFIRFSTDKMYKTKEGEFEDPTWEERKKVLGDFLDGVGNIAPSENLRVYYFFYDEKHLTYEEYTWEKLRKVDFSTIGLGDNPESVNTVRSRGRVKLRVCIICERQCIQIA